MLVESVEHAPDWNPSVLARGRLSGRIDEGVRAVLVVVGLAKTLGVCSEGP